LYPWKVDEELVKWMARAGTAVRQGLISADDDLLYPRFYLDRKLEKWLPKTVKSWLADRPNWVS